MIGSSNECLKVHGGCHKAIKATGQQFFSSRLPSAGSVRATPEYRSKGTIATIVSTNFPEASAPPMRSEWSHLAPFTGLKGIAEAKKHAVTASRATLGVATANRDRHATIP